MIVYAIAQLRFTDRTAHDRYQALFMEVFLKHRGRLLAADESPEVVEGSSDRELSGTSGGARFTSRNRLSDTFRKEAGT